MCVDRLSFLFRTHPLTHCVFSVDPYIVMCTSAARVCKLRVRECCECVSDVRECCACVRGVRECCACVWTVRECFACVRDVDECCTCV